MGRVIVKGQKKLDKHLRMMANPSKLFDPDIKAAARKNVRQLVINTPKETGNTARHWTNVIRVANSLYLISNNVKSADKKHLMVEILDKGRGVVRPKKPGGMLYIPLSQKGKSKGYKQKIPSDFQFGKDFVFSKRSKAYKGTLFLTKGIKAAGKDITRRMSKRIGAI
jgi:hypothetical protein